MEGFELNRLSWLYLPTNFKKSPSLDQLVEKGAEWVDWILRMSTIEKIQNSNHPRKKALLEWLNLDENKSWYLECWKEIELVEWWIKILWQTLSLDDEAGRFWFSPTLIWNNPSVITRSYFEELIAFLPWNKANKIRFFLDVLWMNLDRTLVKHSGESGIIWSSFCFTWYITSDQVEWEEKVYGLYINPKARDIWVCKFDYNEKLRLRLFNN